jgi:hypothetical protein
MPVAVAAPEGLTPKALRAWKFLEAHQQRMASKRGLREFKCGGCNAVIAHYVPPIALFLWPCQHCGHINKYSTSGGDGS